jgi:DNA polymerase III epsilon subunit-like protein
MSLLWGLAAAGKYPLDSCSSESAFRYFKITVAKLHDALEDSLGTVKLFERIVAAMKAKTTKRE